MEGKFTSMRGPRSPSVAPKSAAVFAGSGWLRDMVSLASIGGWKYHGRVFSPVCTRGNQSIEGIHGRIGSYWHSGSLQFMHIGLQSHLSSNQDQFHNPNGITSRGRPGLQIWMAGQSPMGKTQGILRRSRSCGVLQSGIRSDSELEKWLESEAYLCCP
jgi:hypothetical protein